MSPDRSSAWLRIPAEDYEGHMGQEHADQLAPLSEAFAEVYRAYRPGRLALLGCATGNGLEHVDPRVTSLALGIDLSLPYLKLARARHAQLAPALQLVCAKLEELELAPGSLDLVHAALVLEYVEPERAMPRIARWLRPGGRFAAVLQMPSEHCGKVSPSPYTSLATLGGAIQLVAPEHLAALAEREGMRLERCWQLPLKHGKRLHAAVYRGG